MTEENEEDGLVNSFSFGTAGNTGCLKFYFDMAKPDEELFKDFAKMTRCLGWFQQRGYCIVVPKIPK